MTSRNHGEQPLSLTWVAVISGFSSCTAEFVTFPFDWAKTRLQLSGQTTPTHNVHSFKPTPSPIVPNVRKGMLKVMFDASKKEGFGVLFTGLRPALLRQATYGTLKMTLYQHFKGVFSSRTKIRSDYSNALSAVASGALSSAICTPTDLVKVRLQGGETRYQYTGLMDAFVSIVKGEGWKGLYKGVVPTTQRATLITLLTLPTYDFAKKVLLSKDHDRWSFHSRDDVYTHFLASIFSAVVSTLGTQPIDVMKTRMMNQPFDEHGKGLLYNSSLDCMVKTVRTEGITACWKGTIPTFFRSGPWLIVFWCTYEQLKRLGYFTHSL